MQVGTVQRGLESLLRPHELCILHFCLPSCVTNCFAGWHGAAGPGVSAARPRLCAGGLPHHSENIAASAVAESLYWLWCSCAGGLPHHGKPAGFIWHGLGACLCASRRAVYSPGKPAWHASTETTAVPRQAVQQRYALLRVTRCCGPPRKACFLQVRARTQSVKEAMRTRLLY